MTSQSPSKAAPELRQKKKKPDDVTRDDFANDSRYFVDMSVPLTGFDPPELQGTGMTVHYLRTFVEHAGASSAVELYRRCDEEKKKHLSENRPFTVPSRPGEEDLGQLACAVAKMWYLGAWYGLSPSAYALLVKRAAEKGEKIRENAEYMVSADSYVNGLLWRLTGGHAPGAKPPGFGSWAEPPAPVPASPTGPYEETV